MNQDILDRAKLEQDNGANKYFLTNVPPLVVLSTEFVVSVGIDGKSYITDRRYQARAASFRWIDHD